MVLLHHVCHAMIHNCLSETELARHYNSIEALKLHPELARFFAWVRNGRPNGGDERVNAAVTWSMWRFGGKLGPSAEEKELP